MSDLASFAANILVGFTLSFCVLVVAYGRDRQLLVWALTFALHSISYWMVALRGQIPDFISIVIANTLISTMLALYIEGICRIEEIRPRRAVFWWPVFATFAVYWVFIDNFDTRVAIGSLLYAFQTALLIWVVVSGFREREGRGKWIMLGAVFIATGMLLFRGAVTIFGDGSLADVSGTSLIPMVTSLSAMAVLIMFAFGLIVVFKERAELETLNLAMLDPMTGLGNRRLLDNALRHALRTSARDKQYGAVLLIDLDDFKPLNDTYGHGLGDQVLIEVAYRLKECVKAEDVVVRLGGDEFLVLICNLGTDRRNAHDNAEHIAERILSEIGRPYQCLAFAERTSLDRDLPQQCTCSIGIAFFPHKSSPQDKVLEHADVAMYKAKEQGRNRMVIHLE